MYILRSGLNSSDFERNSNLFNLLLLLFCSEFLNLLFLLCIRFDVVVAVLRLHVKLPILFFLSSQQSTIIYPTFKLAVC